MAACYSARQGYLPQYDQFFEESKENDIIDFNQQTTTLKCGIKYSENFELSDNSMEYLFMIISNMPTLSKDAPKKVLKLCTCI